jgi:hypothetical protein
VSAFCFCAKLALTNPVSQCERGVSARLFVDDFARRSGDSSFEPEQVQAPWLDDNDDFLFEELFLLLANKDVRRRRVTRPLGARLRTFAWTCLAVPLWNGLVVCVGTLTIKRLYLQSL